jgi:HEAT repeat protein
MVILAMASTVDIAFAKKKRKGKRVKTKVSKINSEVVTNAKTIFTALAQTTNAGARLAVVKGLIELEGPSREEGLDMAAKASDIEIRLVGLKEILKNQKLHRKRLKSAKAEAEKLFLSAKKSEHIIGRDLLESYLKTRKMKKMWSKALKSGGEAAQYEARAHFIAQGGKTAWGVINKALKMPKGSKGQKQALQAMRDKHYKLAKKWALSHAGMKGEVGEVAKLWIDRVGEKAANKITQGLYKEYLWAAGNKKRPADFPRRVRLAHLLSKRGMIKDVTSTLAVAVKNKKGRVDADLDNAKIRVMGWEGLRACRDRKVLKAVKEMMIELQNREEASPATQWLADWVRDTRDTYAMEVLEEMIDQPRYISRLEAIKALGSLKVRQTRPKILGALESGDPDLKLAAAEALALMSESGDEKELHKLIHKNRKHLEVRLILMRSLIRLNTPETLKTFKSLVNNGEAKLRRVAIEGLIKLKLDGKDLERYLNPLRRNDPKLDIRFTVWKSLLGAGSQKLNRNFKKAARWITSEQLRDLASLKLISTDFFKVMVLSGDDDLSGAALDIFEARGESARADLEMIFKESSEIKSTVRSLSLLSHIAKESGLDLYRKGLESRDAEVRVIAFDAMRQFAPKTSLEEVKVAMENERKPHPRAEAVRAYIAVSQR